MAYQMVRQKESNTGCITISTRRRIGKNDGSGIIGSRSRRGHWGSVGEAEGASVEGDTAEGSLGGVELGTAGESVVGK